MKLIPEWKKAWRMFSVQAMTIAGALQGAWAAMPEEMKSHVPAAAVHIITLVLLFSGIVGRLVVQDKVSGDAASEEKQ